MHSHSVHARGRPQQRHRRGPGTSAGRGMAVGHRRTAPNRPATASEPAKAPAAHLPSGAPPTGDSRSARRSWRRDCKHPAQARRAAPPEARLEAARRRAAGRRLQRRCSGQTAGQAVARRACACVGTRGRRVRARRRRTCAMASMSFACAHAEQLAALPHTRLEAEPHEQAATADHRSAIAAT